MLHVWRGIQVEGFGLSKVSEILGSGGHEPDEREIRRRAIAHLLV
jgi:hypothetical protein